MALVTRSRALLKKILYAPGPLRIKDFAAEFGVSERTIKYDVGSIRMWLVDQGMELKSKPSRGIWIECTEEKRKKLLEQLGHGGDEVFLSQSERISSITLDLLLADDCLTIGRLAEKNAVSRNTALADLAVIEPFLADWSLRIKRSASGIQVTGTEKQRWFVLEKVILDLLDGNDMFRIVAAVAEARKPTYYFNQVLKSFLDSVDHLDLVFVTVGSLVKETERELGVLLSDQCIIGVFIRLCIIISRRSHGWHGREQGVFDFPGTLEGDKGIFAVFRKRLTKLGEETGTRFPEADIWFVCLQALAMISAAPDNQHFARELLPDSFSITRRMIREVGKGLNLPFSEYPDLFTDLLAHISNKLTEYSYGVIEPNPMLHEIRRAYRVMFDQVKAAGIKVFGVYRIYLTDGDVAFMTLHFQNAYERMRGQRKVNALVVCGTGRGTSRLLKTVIESNLKNVSVGGTCSVMELHKMLRQGGHDMVISVLPVNVPVPSVLVSAIPGEADFKSIQEQVRKILQGERMGQDSGLGVKARKTDSEPVRLQMDDPYAVQAWFQNLVFQGFELSRQIVSGIGGHFAAERVEALTLHCIFLMQRTAFGIQYREENSRAARLEGEQPLRDRLLDILQERQVAVTESELQAILKYLE
ncbi:PRD domain-containing protein [Paenibacillus macerans]|uniref:BglG family transcription antiterminator n=1 Tax=Paenibacillus macerans TaxID=44252 RepID=UPI00203C9358|nr:PRD domain-containing protein [Paenibacillus macerans]MCM3699889.1 PRD domain-containing protein [Paenibacillus macerans]